MQVFLLVLGLITLFFAGMSVRLIFLKDGEFKGTCATQNEHLRAKGIKCGCGKDPGDQCGNVDKEKIPAMPEIG